MNYFATIDFEKEYIHGDKFHCVADIVMSSDYPFDSSKIASISDKNAVVFSDGNHILQTLDELRFCKGKYILITHNGDQTIDELYLNRKSDNVLRWYGTNMNVCTEQTQGIPIGLARPRWEPEFDHKAISRLLDKPKQLQNLALLNHTTHTNIKERSECEAWFKDKPWCTFLPIEKGQKRIPINECIEKVNSHLFMISPPGNGVDCHRTWEAIYLGVVPIVKSSIAMRYFYYGTNLPMINVDNWGICTTNILIDEVWNHPIGEEYNYELATMSYWIDQIISDRKRLL